MAMFSSISAAFTGMRGHTDAMQSISDNIVNVQTPGYKHAHTRFKEIISEVNRTANRITQSYMGSAPSTQFFIDKQGTVEFTNRALDVAIQGKGFFVSNTEPDGSGEIELTRNGQMLNKHVNLGGVDQLFLSDVKGNVLLAWPTDEVGQIDTGETVDSLEPVRIDNNAFSITARASTTASLSLNLNPDAATGEAFGADIQVFDETGTGHNINYSFAKTATTNTWDLTATVSDGTISTSMPIAFTFDESGQIASPTTQDFEIAYTNDGGGNATITTDFSNMFQFAGDFTLLDIRSDGNGAGLLDSINFSDTGEIIGNFSNGVARTIYKIPIAIVKEPNQMGLRFNTHYAPNEKSGGISLFEADKTALGDFVAGSLEASTVSLATELNNMVIAQQSFAMNGQSFRAIDEMARIASDLKR
ncbi:MAG: Flagellar hook protein FlgE [Alphaproteobacteria bacterium MarineAlpha4_Bin2]|nr:MAG: Flagellar hook protein FlgE [Alphaproteobacteria bacterium MarineAlpha4_Bin2]